MRGIDNGLEMPSEAVTVFSSYAQLFCASVGSGLDGWVMVPVSVTPARVGYTVPTLLGGRFEDLDRYVPFALSSWIFTNSPAPEPPVYVVL
jgi:hypothetical protein